MATRTIRDGTITLVDGSGTPKTLELTFDGNLYFRISKRNDLVSHRGVMARWVNGGELPSEIRFQGQYEYLARSSTPNETLYDALNNVNSCSTWTSTASAGEAYTLTLRFYIADPAESTDEQIEFSEFIMDSLEFSEGDVNMLFVTGRALDVHPTVTWP